MSDHNEIKMKAWLKAVKESIEKVKDGTEFFHSDKYNEGLFTIISYCVTKYNKKYPERARVNHIKFDYTKGSDDKGKIIIGFKEMDHERNYTKE